MKSLSGSILAALCLLCFAACSQQAAPVDSRATAVDALFAAFDEGRQPGAAVLVTQDGEILYERGFGYANLDTGERIAPDSAFRLASVSKQFTTMAIMVLAEEGLLDFDDPLTTHLPTCDDWPGVTLRHMMHHTSGIPDFYEQDFYAEYDPDGPMVQNAALIEIMTRYPQPDFAPGEQYVYNNTAYDLLPLVIERVAGMSFRDFVITRVFRPAGMLTATPFSSSAPAIPKRVYGYTRTDDGFTPNDYDPFNDMLGSGSVYASLRDFVAWERSLNANTLVTADTLAEAYAEGLLNDGSGTEYGFGWRVEDYRGHPRRMHTGSWVGFRTAFARFPDDGLAVTVLTNRSDGETAAKIDAIADIYLGSKPGG